MDQLKPIESGDEAPAGERGFDVLSLLLVFTRRWRIIALLTVVFGIIGLIVSFTIKPLYTATVTFLVDQETSSAGIFLYRQTDPTVALLGSQTIADFVMDHLDVPSLAKEMKPDAQGFNARLDLRGRARGEATAFKSDVGLYFVKVQDDSPGRAVAIANAYLDALQDLTDHLTFDSAARTTKFYQGQMQTERAALEDAETELKSQQERTGILQPGSQTSLEISQIANLRSQIVNLQVQRATTAQAATAQNPEMIRLDAQIDELRTRINTLQAHLTSATGQDTPSQNLEIGRLERNVAYHQNLLTSLAGQFERSRLQESFNVPRVHVVDRAKLPVPRTWPKHPAITLGVAAIGLFFGIAFTTLSELFERLKSKPESLEKLRQIRYTLRLRKI